MDSTGKIWVALDTEKEKALKIAALVASHPAVFGFKVNRLLDQEIFRRDGEPMLFQELALHGKPVWGDGKFHDIPRTVAGRLEPYVSSGLLSYFTVMAKGEVNMMREAVEAAGYIMKIIAVTELTSLTEEQIHLMSGHPSKASVINLARYAVLAGVRHLVCSSKELEVLKGYAELNCLEKFVPGIKPEWQLNSNIDQKRIGLPAYALNNGADKLVIGSAIVNDKDPLCAVERTAEEIEKL